MVQYGTLYSSVLYSSVLYSSALAQAKILGGVVSF